MHSEQQQKLVNQENYQAQKLYDLGDVVNSTLAQNTQEMRNAQQNEAYELKIDIDATRMELTKFENELRDTLLRNEKNISKYDGLISSVKKNSWYQGILNILGNFGKDMAAKVREKQTKNMNINDLLNAINSNLITAMQKTIYITDKLEDSKEAVYASQKKNNDIAKEASQYLVDTKDEYDLLNSQITELDDLIKSGTIDENEKIQKQGEMTEITEKYNNLEQERHKQARRKDEALKSYEKAKTLYDLYHTTLINYKDLSAQLDVKCETATEVMGNLAVLLHSQDAFHVAYDISEGYDEIFEKGAELATMGVEAMSTRTGMNIKTKTYDKVKQNLDNLTQRSKLAREYVKTCIKEYDAKQTAA